MVMRISKDRVDLDDKRLKKPALQDYSEVVVTETDSGSSYTIDLEEGNVFDITLTDNCSFTFANPPASGTAGSITLFLTQDATGSRTVTWPAAVEWVSGEEPTLKSDADALSIVTFLTLDGGTTWHGMEVATSGSAGGSDGIGQGQTWQDVSGSRSSGTSYQNTTGKPIFVVISCDSDEGGEMRFKFLKTTQIGQLFMQWILALRHRMKQEL